MPRPLPRPAHESADVCTLVYDNKLRVLPSDQHLSSHFSQHIRAMGANQSTQRRRLDPASVSAPVPSLSLSPARAPSPSPRVENIRLRFRVLIIGRANAGKTSILQRVCDTTESPVIYRSGPEGTRHRVCAHSQWRFQSHLLSRLNSTPQ